MMKHPRFFTHHIVIDNDDLHTRAGLENVLKNYLKDTEFSIGKAILDVLYYHGITPYSPPYGTYKVNVEVESEFSLWRNDFQYGKVFDYK
jgi:hypothetical protein